jgi:DNA-directed RNA polymerase subunit H (RpoH/RPB5)
MQSKLLSSRIISLYKSRLTILELLNMEKYDISGYEGFSIHEIESMLKNSQLDMLFIKSKDKTDEKKLYVKYYLGKTLRNNLNDIIEDLFILQVSENSVQTTLNKNDTLVIIIDDDPNETIISKIRYKYEKEGIFIVIFNIKRLQFNVRNHILNPEIRILEDDEVVELKERIKIKDLSQLPEISRFDPLATSIFMRPGQVCHIIRNSPTAIREDYYRHCL